MSDIDKILMSGDRDKIGDIVQSDDLQPHHIDKIIELGDRNHIHDLSVRPDLTSQHIEKMLIHPDLIRGTVRELVNHKNISRSSLNDVIDNEDYSDFALNALKHPNMSSKVLKYHAENHSDPKIRQAAQEQLDNPSNSFARYKTLLKDSNE